MSGTPGLYVPAADARAAASLLLLRDGADGLELLMLRRAERDGDRRSGATVFPGGVLDARDRAAHAHCTGPDDAAFSRRLGVAEGGLDYAIAALRETFEEVGLLLATGSFDLAALQGWRERLQQGTAGAAEFCVANGLKLDLRELAYFAHWLTPPGAAKRFDTRFFAAPAPVGQIAEADGGETVELMWLTPRAALDPARQLKLLPVTRRILQQMASYADVAIAMDTLRRVAEVPLVMPRRGLGARGQEVVVLPHELPYAEIGRLDAQGRGDVHVDVLPGRAVRLSPRIVRVTAPNPGPMTGPGTNSYLVGDGQRCTVIDPGPVSDQHLQALLAAAPGRIERILVTHTHRDHSPGAAALAAATGAPVWGRTAAHAMWQDERFAPDHEPSHGDQIDAGDGVTLRVIHTPGHASNHLCFLLQEEKLLFTGDHVMQGSTVVINPPDGDMAVYLRSLSALLDEELEWFAPGHGFLVADPHGVLRALIAHRLRREAKVLAAVRSAGPADVAALVPVAYDEVPAALHGMAARSLLAHLLKLEGEGAVRRAGEAWSAA